MEATIAQSELSKAFKALKLTLPAANKALIPATSGVHLRSDSATSTVVATTFDTDSFTQVELRAQNVVDGVRVVPGKLFMDLVNKLQGDVQLVPDRTNKTHTVLKYSGGKPAKLSSFDEATYPKLPIFNAVTQFDITTDELKALVRKTAWAFSTSDDQNSMILHGVGISLKPDGNGGQILSLSCTNRVDAAYMETPVSAVGDFDLVIDAQQLAAVAAIMPAGETCYISWDNAFVMFKAGAVTYYGRQLASRFPDLKGNLNKILANKSAGFDVKRSDMIDALEKVGVIVSGGDISDGQADFKFTATGVEIEGKRSDAGEITESLAGVLTGNDIVITLKVPLVLNALKALTANDVTFVITSATTPMVIHPTGATSEMYLALPAAKSA